MSENVALGVIQEEIRKVAARKEKQARDQLVIEVRAAVIDYLGREAYEWDIMKTVMGALAEHGPTRWWNDNSSSHKVPMDQYVEACRVDVKHQQRHHLEELVTKEMMANLLKRR